MFNNEASDSDNEKISIMQRQSNLELLRIVSIILVMLLHSIGHYNSFGVELLKAFSIVGVNVFVMLTGYFSATPKKTSLINLGFICLFWMIVKVIVCYFLYSEIDYKDVFFITRSNWFVANYIALLFLTPILNVFCNQVNKKTLWGVVIVLLFLEVWFDWLPPHPIIQLGSQYGYSVYSFMVLYLIARAIKIHGLPNWFRKSSLGIYLGCSLFMAAIAMLLYKLGSERAVKIFYSYNNPVVVVSSIALLSTFINLKIPTSSVINHIAKSVLPVLLGHTAFIALYKKQFLFVYENYNGFLMILYWIIAVIVVFVTIVGIDQIRLLLYHPVEELMKSKIKNNNIFELSENSK